MFGYGVVLLAGFVAIYETYRGAAARTHHATKESLPRALIALFGRNRRRYGGFIVHLGITVIGIGVIGSTLFQLTTQQTLAVGQSVSLGQYTMTYNGMLPGQIADDNRVMDIAQVTVSQDGQRSRADSPAPRLLSAVQQRHEPDEHRRVVQHGRGRFLRPALRLERADGARRPSSCSSTR